METWPWPLVFFWRIILLPAVAALALCGLFAVATPPVAIFLFTVILLNLIAAQFSADSRRIAALEERLDSLQRALRDEKHRGTES